jgi:hypothetical protein
MTKKPLRLRLKAVFSAAVLGFAGMTSAVYAQETPTAAPDTLPDVAGMQRDEPTSVQKADRRGVEERTDDFFSTRYKVYATKESIWIGMPQRYNVDILSRPDNDVIRMTRQYMELRPLRKEWYGNATGVGVGLDYDLGRAGGYDLGGGTWHLRGGTFIGSFESPYIKGEGRARHNDVFNTFVEGSRSVSFGKTEANLIVGASFNRAAGPHIDRASDARLYQQINFPTLFGSAAGDNGGGIGRYSGAVQTYVGDGGAYGGKIGIYYNSLKSEGMGINFSIGPEVHYDKERGASFRLRVRASPRFL